MLLAIDPSIRCAGWAVFALDGTGPRLQTAGTVDQSSHDPFEMRIAGLLERLEFPWTSAGYAVVEFPRVYPGAQAEDPNDLFAMAAQVGTIIRAFGPSRVTLVYPAEWKGNVEKHAFNERILSRLSPEELARVPRQKRARKHPYNHNMVDAIGIGLHHLGRLEPRRAETVDYASKGLVARRRA